MRKAGTVLAAAVALTLVAAGTAAGLATAPVRVSGPSPYSRCTAGGPGVDYPGTTVGAYVAADPRAAGNLVGVWQQDRWADGGARGVVAGYSADGGATWAESELPFGSCAGGLSYGRAADPWVSIGADGTVYADAVVFDQTDGRTAVAAAVSGNGGKTWGPPVTVASYGTSRYFPGGGSVTADPVRAGVAYCVWDTLVGPGGNPKAGWHTAAHGGSAYLSVTTDHGRTWSPPREIFPAGDGRQAVGDRILVDPARPATVYDFADWVSRPQPRGERDRLAFTESTDGGRTWSAPRTVFNLNDVPVIDPNTGAAVRSADNLPSVSIGADGRLAAVWQDSSFNGGAYDAVAFSASFDGGSHWTRPKQVNAPRGVAAFDPTVRIGADGAIAVTYYDFRYLAPGNTATLPTDYWLTGSTDNGKKWPDTQHIAGSFDLAAAPVAGGLSLGDHQGLAAVGPRSFEAFFTMTSCPLPAPGPCSPVDRTAVYAAAVGT